MLLYQRIRHNSIHISYYKCIYTNSIYPILLASSVKAKYTMKIKAEDPLPGFSAACSTEQLGRKKRLDPLDLRIEHITALANKLHEERERNREDSAKKKRDRRARTKQKIEELLRKGKDLREGEKRRKEAGRKVKLKFPKQSTKEVEGIHKIKRASKKEKAKREYSNEDSLREEKKANEVSNQGGIENTPGDLHTADFLIADYDFAGLEDDDLPFLKGEVVS